MKKFVFVILTAFICFAAFETGKAQSPTPTVGKEWVKYSLKSTNLATSKPSAVVLFYPDQNVEYIQVFVAYSNMAGDSCNVQIFPSPDGTNFKTGYANRRTSFLWKTGQGATKYISDTVNLTLYPTAYLKIVCDTLTKMTTGSVSVWIKPHFK
jgi:hypothetical protein